MDAIYTKKDTTSWLEEFKIDAENEVNLEKQFQWCEVNKLNFTPVILINGKAYPKGFDREDLFYFVDGLIEDVDAIE